MFQHLQNRFHRLLQKLAGTTRLTPVITAPLLLELKETLLASDVALEVVETFMARLKEALDSETTSKSLNAEQLFLKVTHAEMTKLLSPDEEAIGSSSQEPTQVTLMLGLQGSGKTTSSAKLARKYRETGKKVLLASVDLYRPAAVEQLKRLAQTDGIDFFEATSAISEPVALAKAAWQWAKAHHYDTLVLDTAGRLHLDSAMMQELTEIIAVLRPQERLLVVDGMLGQDSAIMAKRFHEASAVTGFILTKMDGDAKGGAALSIVALTKRPILWIGTGEKLDKLETFHPDRIATRMLGQGDLFSLMEEIEKKSEQAKLEALVTKKQWDLNDFLTQIEQIDRLGGMASLLEKMPVAFQQMGQKAQLREGQVSEMKALICSMTPKERARPSILRSSHKRRIASGAGSTPQALNNLLKLFDAQQKMMGQFSGMGFKDIASKLGSLGNLFR